MKYEHLRWMLQILHAERMAILNGDLPREGLRYLEAAVLNAVRCYGLTLMPVRGEP